MDYYFWLVKIKFMNKVLTEHDKINNIRWNNIVYTLEKEMIAIIVLTKLYEKNIITREKLMGQLQSLRVGTLTEFKKTHHCTINDKWYNEEHFTDIFEDLFHYREINSQISVSYPKLLEVLQLYSNKNYNFCINTIVDQIIKPTLVYFSNSSYDYFIQLFETSLNNFPTIKQEGYRSECSCCGSSEFQSDSKRTREEGIEKIKNLFHQFKKGNLSKIPKN